MGCFSIFERKILKMLTLSRSPRHFRQLWQCACYSSSPPSKQQEQPQPKETQPTTSAETSITSTAKPVEIATDSTSEYRTSWHQNEGEYFNVLKSFYSAESNASLLKLLQTPVNLSPSAIKAWWKNKKHEKTLLMQTYLPQRSQMLGCELAAAHFIVYRGGAVKFFGEDRWIRKDSFGKYSLPVHYDDSKVVEALDCSDMELYYEGFSNLRDLKRLQWLSFQNCETIDDWCLDRISHLYRDSLVYLDLRDCPNYTFRGLGALYKMNQLKILLVDDIQLNRSFEMTCLMLQDLNPSLDIRVD